MPRCISCHFGLSSPLGGPSQPTILGLNQGGHMSRRAKFDTAEAQLRRFKEGRGQGSGPNFKPYLRVKDVPSLGRRHRAYNHKVRRVQHSMSDLELWAQFAEEYCDEIKEGKEQFPHLLSRTQAIASAKGYRHPRAPGATQDNVVTTDRVWTITTPKGTVLQPISCKYHQDIARPRVRQKHEIEEESWKQDGGAMPLRYFHENSVTRNFVVNWNLVRATLRPGYFKRFPKNLVVRVDRCLRRRATAGQTTLDLLSVLAAAKLAVAQGQVVTAIHYLIASKKWRVDLDDRLLVPSQALKFL